ncbi:hypothetical protein OG339_11835 [Streptosporangium sp. NBC_01495]|uniref:hypothetical protein n=1 Tax=Streptosporangium sp. NBC_01495 TaxID=2903899 RepID=UPI002E32CA7E|nr:hypothetical protein [Streptosporangium sp. NBC_01495]
MARSEAARNEPGHRGSLRQDTATRNLCAGVYLDPAFCRVVLRRVHNDTTRMVAPSYGFDLVSVVRHAWWAWGLEMAQHVCVLAIFAIGFAVDPLATFTVASGAGFWCLSRLVVRSARVVLPLRAKAAVNKWLRKTRWHSESDELRQQTRLLRLSSMGCAVLAVLPFLMAALSSVPLDDMTRATVFLALLIAVAVGGTGAAYQWRLNRMHKTESLGPQKLTLRLQAIKDQQSHPYVVYRRPLPPVAEAEPEDLVFDLVDENRSPFVGSGKLLHRWLPPLTIQLFQSFKESEHKPMEELEHPKSPFETHELVEHLKRAMAPIGNSDDPTGLPGFTSQDRLYIAEADVQSRPEWLEKRPDQSDIDDFIDNPYGAVHHFLEIGATATGELVTTVFLRVTVKGRALSLDFAACALTRTPAEYHALNAFAESGTSAVVRSALRSLFNLPAEVAGMRRLAEAPLLLIGAIRARKNRMLKPRRGMAIGAQLSIREEKSTPWKQAQLDEVMIHDHIKLFEQRLLRATEDFLESCKLDTSAFKKRATGIINNGVLNMGGKTEIKQSAIGTNAQVRADTREPDKNTEQSSKSEGDQ